MSLQTRLLLMLLLLPLLPLLPLLLLLLLPLVVLLLLLRCLLAGMLWRRRWPKRERTLVRALLPR